MEWILIIVLFTGSGASVATQEFSNLESCANAKLQLKMQSKPELDSLICVPKNVKGE